MSDIDLALKNGASLDDLPLIRPEEKAWCKSHPTAYIGKDQWGNWYATCTHGYKEREQGKIPTCEIVVER